MGLAIRSETSAVSWYHPYWFGCSRFAVAFGLGYAVFPCRPPLANNFHRYADKPLVRFRRPPGLSRMTASRSLSTSTPSLGFAPSWHMRSQKVRFPRAVPDPPPSVRRVSCHPLDGLLPFAPCPPCFRRTAPAGFSLRSLLFAKVEPAFLPIRAPLAVTTGLASTSLLDSAKLGPVDRLPGTALGESLAFAAGV